MKIKKIIIDAISDEMLKGLLKFSILDCDKVVVEINKNITIEDINNKILELNKIRYDLIELLFNDDLWKDIDDKKVIPDKYINNWIEIEFDENNELSITMNHEDIDKLINFLISINYEYTLDNLSDYVIYWEDSIENFIQDKFMSAFFIKEYCMPKYKSKSILNYNYEIEFIYK